MKTTALLPIALAALCAGPLEAAEPADEIEPVAPEPGAWRLSVGVRAAPGIKTSATVDARAAAVRAGLPAAGRTQRTVSVAPGKTVSTTEGTTEDDARAALGPGYTGEGRYEFDGGYIDPDDGAGIEGETQNWHIDDASAVQDGVIVLASQSFASRTTARARSTRTETASTVETSFAEAPRDGNDDTAPGVELRLDRTLWEDADFGLDLGIGYAWYDDVDCFSVAGRACTVTRTESTTTETIDFTGLSSDSGTVSWTLSAPEFSDLDEIRNEDGSLGGGYVVGGALPDGWKIPVLSLDPDRFGTFTKHGPSLVGAYLSRSGSSSRKSTTSTLDVRSDGTLSLQELRLGVSPFWKATERLTLRAGLGLLGTYSEIETETRLLVDGVPAASFRKSEDDWTLGGYAGLALGAAITESVELSVGAEARFPRKKLRFDDGVVSGSVRLAGWSAFAGVSLRF